MPSTQIIADYSSFKTTNIPFYASDLNRYGVVVTTDLSRAEIEGAAAITDPEERAANLLIKHYLPEYGGALIESSLWTTGDYGIQSFQELIRANVVLYQYAPDSGGNNKACIMTRPDLVAAGTVGTNFQDNTGATTLDFALLREYLARIGWPNVPGGSGPSAAIQQALAYFNSAVVDTSPTVMGTSPIYLATVVQDAAKFKSTMLAFHDQRASFPGTLKHSIDFRLLARKIPYLIKNVLMLYLFENINTKGTPESFLQGDYIQLSFGESGTTNLGLNSMDYYSPSNAGGNLNPVFAKIGYFTNVSYINYFQDEIFLTVFKNYAGILALIRQYERDNMQLSFLDFMHKFFPPTPGADPSDYLELGTPTIEDYVAAQNKSYSFKNLEANVNSINVQNLYQSINNILCMDEEEVRQVRVANEDKKTQAQIYRQEKNKVLDTGIAVTTTAETVLTNRPITGLTSITAPGGQQTKEQRVLNLILSQIGVDELAKEVLTCFTFGMNFEAGRFAAAIRASLSANRTTIFSKPLPPEEVARQSLSEKLCYYSVTATDDEECGSALWKDLLNLVLSSIAQGAYSIITGLASLIREHCNELLGMEPQPGVADCASLVRGNAPGSTPAAQNMDIPNLEDAVDAALANFGFGPEDGDTYLSDVSSILTVPEICRLFYSQEDVTDELIDKILQFNSNYPGSPLNNASAILSFFHELAQVVDFREYCDDWINRELVTAMQNCCLTEGDLLDALGEENLQNILDIINGEGVVEAPPINLECPDSPDYVENSVMTNTIPSLFDAFMTPLQMEFAYAADSVKSGLLDTTIENNGSAAQAIADMCQELGLDTSNLNSSDDGPDTEAIGNVADAFSTMSDVTNLGPLIEMMEDCPVDWSKFPGANVADILTTAFNVFSDTSEAAAEMFTSIEDKLNNIAESLNTGASGGPLNNVPYTVLVFPQEFRDNFEQYFPEGVGEQASDTGGSPSFARFFEREAVHYTEPITGMAYAVTDNLGHLDHLGKWGSSGSSFTEQRIRFEFFNGAEYIEIFYPSYTDCQDHIGDPWALRAPLLSTTPYHLIKSGDAPMAGSAPGDDINPSIWRFVDPVMQNLDEATTIPEYPGTLYHTYYRSNIQKRLSTQYFAAAFSGLVSQMIPDIVEKGIFSVEEINNLNFFKDNTLCDPQNVGDLLDVDGIMHQINKEFNEAVCMDSGDFKDKVKDTLRYGLFNLLVQIYVVEFILKNIFVMAAFNLSDLLNGTGNIGPIFRQIMVSKILDELGAVLSAPGALMPASATLFSVYNKKLRRYGGVIPYTNTALGLPALDPGSGGFSLSSDADFKAIIEHLVTERMSYIWQDESVNPPASRSTTQSIMNILNFNNPQGHASLQVNFWKDAIRWSDPYLGQLQTVLGTGTDSVPAGSVLDPHFPTRLPASTETNPQTLPRGYDYGLFVVEKHVAWDPRTVYDRNVVWTDDAGNSHTGRPAYSVTRQSYFDAPESVTPIVPGGPSGPWQPSWAPAGGVLANAPTIHSMDVPGSFHGWHFLPAEVFFQLTEWSPDLEFPDIQLYYKLVYYFPIAPPDAADDNPLDQELSYDYIETSNGGLGGSDFVLAGELQKNHLWTNGFQGIPVSNGIGDIIGGSAGSGYDYDVSKEIWYLYGSLPETYGLGGLSVPFPPDRANLCPTAVASYLVPPSMYNLGGGYSGTGGNLYTDIKFKFLSGRNPADPTQSATDLGVMAGGYVNPHGNHRDRSMIGYGSAFGYGSLNSFFDLAINEGLVTTIPMLMNLLYTEKRLPDLDRAFKGPKDTVMSLLGIIDKNQTAASRNARPGLNAGQQLQQTMANSNLPTQDDFGAAAQAFILKAIKDWALAVLKALLEIIDPHVHMSKIIRDLTSEVFIGLSKAIQKSIEAQRAANPGDAILQNLTGTDILTVILCVIDTVMGGLPLPTAPGGLSANVRFLPKVSMNGVDFTATGLGMLMTPPSPLGILYCLLYMISIEPGNTDGSDGPLGGAPATGMGSPNPSNEC